MDLPNLQKNVPLAPFTTYQIGGPADNFVEVHSARELAQAVIAARSEGTPYFILGTGANILVSDKGIRGLVIRNLANRYEFSDHGVTAESGVTIAELLEQARQRELSGFEHFAGIVSSVGGAIWQNLHFLAPDRESTFFIASILKAATILDAENTTRTVEADFFKFGYDDSRLHHEPIVVLDATFSLTPSSQAAIEHQIQENLAWRRAKQPQLEEFASAGSVFKKIEGVGAGRLIDQAGLKSYTHGHVQVSPKHANYLVNLGGATATEVRELITHIQKTVKAKTGYELEPEISFVGEWSLSVQTKRIQPVT